MKYILGFVFGAILANAIAGIVYIGIHILHAIAASNPPIEAIVVGALTLLGGCFGLLVALEEDS